MTKILIDRAVVEQALEALEYYRSGEDYQPTPASEAITALNAALAEPQIDPVDEYRKGFIAGQIDMRDRDQAQTVQEPVAWMVYTLDGKSVCVTDNPADFTEQHKALPLYTSDPIYTMLCDLKQKGNSNERS